MLAIPSKDQSGKYAWYWLASANASNFLWFVGGGRGDVDSYDRRALGVRPVVSLKSTVLLELSDTQVNSTQTWKIAN